MSTTRRGVAIVNGTCIIIITNNRVVFTTSIRVTLISSASIIVIAGNCSIVASNRWITDVAETIVDKAGNVNRGTAIGRIATVLSTQVSSLTLRAYIGKYTTG
jgi:hypothetical protein